MTFPKHVVFAASLVIAVSTGLSAQTNSSAAPSGRGRQQPCWQQAGISQSAMQQHRELIQNTRAQVESVCTDSSLSPQQKQQKIHQLREQVHRQMEGMISPEQMQTMKSCQEQRGRAVGEMHGQGNPCANLSSNSPQKTSFR